MYYIEQFIYINLSKTFIYNLLLINSKMSLEKIVNYGKKILLIGATSTLIGLTAYCGGGSGGGSSSGGGSGNGNRAPNAVAQVYSVNPSNQYHTNYVHPGNTVTLDGSNSSDPDNDNLIYSWSVADKPFNSSLADGNILNRNTAYPSFIPDVEDLSVPYKLKLNVSDGKLSGNAYVSILAINNNAPTTPNISPGDTPNQWEGNLITFTANGSTDSDGAGALVYAIINSNLPADPDIAFNQSTGAFNWPTDCNDSGSYTLDVVAIDDDNANSVPHTVTITVLNDPTCSVPTN